MLKKTVLDMHRDSLADYRSKEKLPIIVILDNIRSLNNIGSIFRTADAFRVEEIFLCGISATPPSPEIHKTALGAEDSVRWSYFGSTLDALAEAKRRGYLNCALELAFDSVPLNGFSPRRFPAKGYAIVAGHEVDGVQQQVVDACDLCIEIPQQGTKHSLNVAVSTAIALWHLFSFSLPQEL